MRCPKCGAFLKDDSIFCNYCGEKLNVSTRVRYTEESVRPRDENFSVNSEEQAEEEVAEVIPRQKPGAVIAILGAALLFALIAIFVFNLLKDNQFMKINKSGPTIAHEDFFYSTEETETESEENTQGIDPIIKEETLAEESSESESVEETEQESTEEPETLAESTEEPEVPTEISEETETAAESTEESHNESSAFETEPELINDGETMEIDGIEYSRTGNEIIVNKCKRSEKYMILPDEIGGYPVTKIGTEAFINCSSLEKVSIPKFVTVISDRAFCNCVNLEIIRMGVNVSEVGEDVFDGDNKVVIYLVKGSYSERYASYAGRTYKAMTEDEYADTAFVTGE